MYLTAQRVLSRSTGQHGINAYLYLHDDGESEYRRIDWRNPDVNEIADAIPGRHVTSLREVLVPGSDVQSYLDIVASDGTSRHRVDSALAQFAAAGPAPVPGRSVVVDEIGLRFGANLGLPESQYAAEVQALAFHAMSLFPT